MVAPIISPIAFCTLRLPRVAALMASSLDVPVPLEKIHRHSTVPLDCPVHRFRDIYLRLLIKIIVLPRRPILWLIVPDTHFLRCVIAVPKYIGFIISPIAKIPTSTPICSARYATTTAGRRASVPRTLPEYRIMESCRAEPSLLWVWESRMKIDMPESSR
ncbi:hypothetical protein FHW17_004073 [Phyllobacterium sp. P30BS-XVII]|nr:hypothetical protein [Phyllobacterium sp. P30BS-XVII]